MDGILSRYFTLCQENTLLDDCHKGDVVEVKRLLPQVRDPAHMSNSAMYATKYLWHGRVADVGDNCKKTLLHYSCHYGWLDVTRRSVEQYLCDPESRDNDGGTPLHEACCESHACGYCEVPC